MQPYRKDTFQCQIQAACAQGEGRLLADRRVLGIEKAGDEARRLLRLHLEQPGQALADDLGLWIAKQGLRPEQGLCRQGLGARNGPGRTGPGSWLWVGEQGHQVDEGAGVAGLHQTHGAGGAQVHRRVHTPAPDRLGLTQADAHPIELGVLAVQGHQGASDGALGHALGVTLVVQMAQTLEGADQIGL